MIWAERFPFPGGAPAKPADEEPTQAAEFEHWWQARERWNSYVMACRRHDLAIYVDGSIAREAAEGGGTLTDLALRTIAMMILDGSLPSNFVVPHSIWKL